MSLMESKAGVILAFHLPVLAVRLETTEWEYEALVQHGKQVLLSSLFCTEQADSTELIISIKLLCNIIVITK